MLFYTKISEHAILREEELREGLREAFQRLGERKKVIAVPPDYTRVHSHAGLLTRLSWEYYRDSLTDVLPALGTHSPMTDAEIQQMFFNVPRSLFRIHNWRTDIVTLGEVPPEYVYRQSEGKVHYGWKAQVNKLLVDGKYDLILSLGQVVPHEVIGMANYTKNIFIGTGGPEGIHKSHFLGAAYGMERIMGRADTPVRRVINYAADSFAKHLPIVYVLTVVAADGYGNVGVRGLFIGDDVECFNRAADLSLGLNFAMLEKPLDKVVVYLDPREFKSTWLGNKSIYRTRMAIADGGELIVLAPGVKEFGEDKQIDALIRKYGYAGTLNVLEYVRTSEDLRNSLGAAAHLIHGSTEGRFSVTYCPGSLSKKEIESVNYSYARLDAMLRRYDPKQLHDGFNELPNGEKIYYISRPELGLWACEQRFRQSSAAS